MHSIRIYKKFYNWYIVLSSIQKYIVAIRMIGYGVPSDATDEYTRAAKNTAMEGMKRFVRAIRGVYEKKITTTHTTIFEKTNVNQQSKRFVRYVWLNKLHALSVEELSSSMEWTIFRQRWQYVNYFGSNSKPNSLDLACNFWNYGI